MKLDPRIIDKNKIYTVINSEDAHKYIDSKGYFLDNAFGFEDLSCDYIHTLEKIEFDNPLFGFKAKETMCKYSYFLPLNNVR